MWLGLGEGENAREPIINICVKYLFDLNISLGLPLPHAKSPFVQQDGQVTTVEAESSGETILKIALDNNVPME